MKIVTFLMVSPIFLGLYNQILKNILFKILKILDFPFSLKESY